MKNEKDCELVTHVCPFSADLITYGSDTLQVVLSLQLSAPVLT